MRFFYLHMAQYVWHRYGWIESPDDGQRHIDIEMRITAKETARLNRHDRFNSYSPGDLTTRYEDQDRLIADAIEKAKGLAGAEPFILFRGSACYLSPQHVLYCTDEDLKARLDEIVARYKTAYTGLMFYTDDERKIDDEWTALMEELKGEEEPKKYVRWKDRRKEKA